MEGLIILFPLGFIRHDEEKVTSSLEKCTIFNSLPKADSLMGITLERHSVLPIMLLLPN